MFIPRLYVVYGIVSVCTNMWLYTEQSQAGNVSHDPVILESEQITTIARQWKGEDINRQIQKAYATKSANKADFFI